MKILLISTAFNGLTQRFYTELTDANYNVSVELHHGDNEKLLAGVNLFKPNLILCPFLTRHLSANIYKTYPCIIVHPGIKGDRSASSLDWTIQNNLPEWGVTLLQADEEMDAGDIWSSKTFPMRLATKSSLYNREVTETAVKCLWEVLTYFESPGFKPEPLDYKKADVTGQFQPFMKQHDRSINWQIQTTDEIIRCILAADGSPGVLDEIYGQSVFLHNAHKEHDLTGKAGEIIATANQAICRATVDGAVWIGHLKRKLAKGEKTIKLPSTTVLANLLSKDIKNIEIDYSKEGKQLPCQELWYSLEDNVAYLHFEFHNGAMNTQQCELLLQVYKHAATLPIKAIVLLGGENYWSNGIHLNTIEAAESTGDESWFNINAINDIIHQLITTTDKLTISAMGGNSGAGGVMLALGADYVFARKGTIMNPHYKSMGDLFGSEYWTYCLPKRVGSEKAIELTEQCLPISTIYAAKIGLVDKVLDNNHALFYAQVKNFTQLLISDNISLQEVLNKKTERLHADESKKSLNLYRKEELKNMYINFYGNDKYHKARHCFVFKISCGETPSNIALHRKNKILEVTV
ncbi:MAG: hydrogenase maturation protein [Methylococcales bacterium]|nr:hydrogenase maturation protein [Methylococcales bacterium]